VRNRAGLVDWDGTLRSGWRLEPWQGYLVERGYAGPCFLAEFKSLVDHQRRGVMDHDRLARRGGK
jgi:hypothetical protein